MSVVKTIYNLVKKKEGNDSISIIAQSNKDLENSLNDKFNIKS